MRLPFNGRNKITSTYGRRTFNGNTQFHKGWDIVGLDDTTIYAPCDGVIGMSTIITNKNNLTWEWGNYVRLDCSNGDRIYFCHMSQRLVSRGQTVKEGQKLGIMGNTGYSFGAHTHMEIRVPPYYQDQHTNPHNRFTTIPNKSGIYSSYSNISIPSNSDGVKPMLGIDVSRYQGIIDWNLVKKSGIEFAIIRAGYGKFIEQKDPYFETNYAGAKQVGIPVGQYWYSYAKDSFEAIEEAKVFLQVIKGKRFEFPLYFDQEDKCLSKIDGGTKTQIANTFCDYIEKHHYFQGYYTYTQFAKGINYALLSNRYTCWLADYRQNYDKTLIRDIHQYTSSGKVNGIKGRVDMNKCTKNFPVIVKQNGLNGYGTIDKDEVIPATPIISNKPNMVKLENKRLKVNAGNCEYFNTYNVNNPKGYLPKNGVFVCLEKSTNMVNGFFWCIIKYQGNNVWVALVEDNRATIIDTPAIEKFYKLDKVRLNGKLYSSSWTNKGYVKNSIYWIYDGIKFNGRYRVTNSRSRCGAQPVGANVSGYVDEKDIVKI